MMDMPPSLENEHLGAWHARLHFNCQPERCEDIRLPDGQEGWHIDPVKPVKAIVVAASRALGFKGLQRHVIFVSRVLILDHPV